MIIHHDQVGFFLGMQGCFNIEKSINVIHYIIKQRKNDMVISLNSEKAFDKIQHPIILQVLEKSGIQASSLKMVKVIYCKLVANIKLNGKKIEAIPLN